MKKKIIYTDEPLDKIQVVADFLPPPGQLVFREDKGKSAQCADLKSERYESQQSFDRQ